MQSIFRTLQEVTDMVDGEPQDEDEGPLREKLLRTEKELQDVREKWEAMKAECLALSEEYVAYKTKVQTWRDQMKVARSQDRKTIELLRAAQSEKNSPSGPEGTATNAAYVSSLEEQVRQLKESLRKYGDERDAMQVELWRYKDQLRQARLEISEAQERPPNAGSPSSADAAEDTDTTRPARAKSAHEERLRSELEQQRDEITSLRQQVHELEQSNEQLLEEARQASHASLVQLKDHQEEIRRTPPECTARRWPRCGSSRTWPCRCSYR